MIDPAFLKKMAIGFAVGSELVATIIAGLMVGYFADTALETSPFGLLIFALLALAGGGLRLTQALSRLSDDDPQHPEPGP